MGQPVHEEKRCRGWADGTTSKSSSWWAAAAGRMSTLIVIAGHHTRHATLHTFLLSLLYVLKTINLSKTVVNFHLFCEAPTYPRPSKVSEEAQEVLVDTHHFTPSDENRRIHRN